MMFVCAARVGAGVVALSVARPGRLRAAVFVTMRRISLRVPVAASMRLCARVRARRSDEHAAPAARKERDRKTESQKITPHQNKPS
jgi:hypothetical protein